MRSLQRPRRGIALLLSLIFIGCGSATPQPDAAVASEPAPAPVADDVLRAGLESPYVLRSGDGTAWLGVLVTPPADAVARPPLALALVVVFRSTGSSPRWIWRRPIALVSSATGTSVSRRTRSASSVRSVSCANGAGSCPST